MVSDNRRHVENFHVQVSGRIEVARQGHEHHRDCECCRKVERHLDLIQSEVEKLLARTSPVPARVQLHAS